MDLVVRLADKLNPRVVPLTGDELQEEDSHGDARKQWQLFRRHALKAMRDRFGDDVTSGRKTLKLAKGKLQADADLVVTLSYKGGIGLYLPDERRWVVSYPQQHHQRGLNKEEATGRRFKRTVRMFKAARNRLVDTKAITKEDAPSYFVECLLYNVPDQLFKRKLAPTYSGILDWLETAKLRGFKSQNGQVPLFGQQREQWTVDKAQAFVRALQGLWDAGVESGGRYRATQN